MGCPDNSVLLKHCISGIQNALQGGASVPFFHSFQLFEFRIIDIQPLFFTFWPEFQLGNRILFNFLLIIIQSDHNLDQLTQHIHPGDFPTETIHCGYPVADRRKLTVQIFIGLFLILQTAHKTSAYTGYLGRIQGQILFLRHLYGHRRKLR